MSNYCPFITAPTDNYDLVPVECLGEKCKFWNVEESECWLLITAKAQSVPLDIDPVVQQLVTLNEKVAYLESLVDSNTEYIKHFHEHHLHAYPHDGEDMTGLDMGIRAIAMLPDTSVLFQEYNSRRDIDGNGLIYGVDFKISDGDDKPLMLRTIENDVNWKPPDMEMSYSEYLESMGWPLRYPTEEE